MCVHVMALSWEGTPVTKGRKHENCIPFVLVMIDSAIMELTSEKKCTDMDAQVIIEDNWMSRRDADIWRGPGHYPVVPYTSPWSP